MAASPSSTAAPLQGSVYEYRGFRGLGDPPYYDKTLRLESKPPPPLAEPEVAWTTGAGRVSITRLSPTVFRVDYEGHPGDVLSVGGRQPSTFTLSSTPTPFVVPHVANVERRRGYAMCASWDNLTIQLDGTVAALRAHWTRNKQSSDRWLVATDGRFELGLATCGAKNLDPRELDTGGQLQLFAIAPDGSEHLLFDGDVSPATMPVHEEPEPSYELPLSVELLWAQDDRPHRHDADLAAIGALLAFLAACVVGVPAVALHGIRGRGHRARPLPRARLLRRP